MKEIIRRETYETNSSMSHSMVILTKADSKRWEEDELYAVSDEWFSWDKWEKKPERMKLYTLDEVLEMCRQNDYFDPDAYEDMDNCLKDEGFVRYSTWEELELELEENEVTTPGGEEIVVHCAYGSEY